MSLSSRATGHIETVPVEGQLSLPGLEVGDYFALDHTGSLSYLETLISVINQEEFNFLS
ncbi:hypothetical protein HN789_03995 [archaeon]|jgi:hypothetical protein|nr:hypothetical protein [archaeon]MBT4022515.1 hypothetical protein [archaeon]MBT4272354.1 hypothetical protein [archaeon]MBT4460463.1 hypothetical protein [archaeon]MBT4858482.1 hypothetical protein [archaeon]